MSTDVFFLAPDATLTEAVAALRSRRIRHLPIVENGRLIGIVTDRDVKRALPSLLEGTTQEEHDRLLSSTAISRIMTREPVTTTPTTKLKDALTLMIENRYGGLPVLDGNRLCGIVTENDLLRLLLKFLA
jgi:acetoin utilization protein AcuB